MSSITIQEESRNLFSVSNDYAFVHCISSDFALGAGIARQFKNIGVRTELFWNYKANEWFEKGYCLMTKTNNIVVYNLVTKKLYWHKPTYKTLTEALTDLKQQLIKNNCDKIAMPYIGCGLDRLKWNRVKAIIHNIFKDTNIDIKVCHL